MRKFFATACLTVLMLSCSDDKESKPKAYCEFTFKGVEYKADAQSVLCLDTDGIISLTASDLPVWQLTFSTEGVIILTFSDGNYMAEGADIAEVNSVFSFEETLEGTDDSGVISGSCSCGE